ncbi:MAG: VOC family protein [Ilumatobacteraceae bacterium]|nr:VOC family protein [Ilumatobacteraceae bacterium]
MSLRITEICFNCADPTAMAEFWCAALGYHETQRDETGVAIAGASNAPVIMLARVDDVATDSKIGHNRLHLDLSPTDIDQDAEVARLEQLGARRIDVGQGSPTWVVMADPEGNEFCVLRRPVPPEPEPFTPPDLP